ncbi:benzoate 4-monooxygenase cytochrome P450 [Xylariaceae sp. FL0804]|nr:benzoate 4-monooxygenase cytochrome P450 [Xylariaceae sp. FL0804]
MATLSGVTPLGLACFAARAGLFCVCILVAIVIRRLWFHHFSQVPGPFLARATSLYSAYHSWRGTMHLDIQRCHMKYGDMIRYAPNQVLSLHPPDMVGIYGHGKPFRKARGYETMIPIPDGWSTMTSIDKKLHHNLRRVFRSGVGAQSLALYDKAVVHHLEVYFAQIMGSEKPKAWSQPADMRKWDLYLGFDTMSDLGFGVQTNLLRSPARDFVFPALHVHEKKMGLWEQLPTLSGIGVGNAISKLLLLFSPRAKSFARWYEKFMEQAIANNTEKSNGIFGPVIQSGLGLLERPGHNHAQMIGEGAFSTFSSADAYGMMLSGLLHYLSHNPTAYETLAREMRSIFKPGEDVVWDCRLESHIYLRAVMDEVMRMLPPACGVHWRECEDPVTVGPGGLLLPVGSNIGMSLFSLFRDGRIFRDPTKFWPERWLEGVLPQEEYALARQMFTPFSIGPRNCAGSHVAIRVASIAYAYVLVNYDFRHGPEQPAASPKLWSNTSDETGEESELRFQSHYSIAGWESGPFIQFRAL